MEPNTNPENLIQYRLTQIEKKVDASDLKAAEEFKQINDKLDQNLAGLINRKEYESDQQRFRDKFDMYVTKEMFDPVATKANNHSKIFIYILTTVGGVVLVSLTYFALSGALSK